MEGVHDSYSAPYFIIEYFAALQMIYKRGVTDVRRVFLLTVDEKGNLYLTQKEGAS